MAVACTQHLELLLQERIGSDQLHRSLKDEPSLILGRSCTIRLRVVLVFHQQVINRQTTDQEALFILFADTYVRRAEYNKSQPNNPSRVLLLVDAQNARRIVETARVAIDRHVAEHGCTI